tara:strand:+ start:386 stop:757 length:372 start_codon:yes stop_codon:yes gene_type:complete
MDTARYNHPRPISYTRRYWQREINTATRDLNNAIHAIERCVATIKAGEPYRHLGLSYQAERAERARRTIDEYQRLLDGRPTFKAETDAAAASFEAAMRAEYQREVNGGWADDEFNARIDSKRA